MFDECKFNRNVDLYKKNRKRTMYIAGAITGVENYKDLFAEAEQVLKRAGYETFNPTCLPPGMEYESYLRIGKQIIEEVDGIYMLENWEDSEGAKIEHEYAKKLGKFILLQSYGF